MGELLRLLGDLGFDINPPVVLTTKSGESTAPSYAAAMKQSGRRRPRKIDVTLVKQDLVIRMGWSPLWRWLWRSARLEVMVSTPTRELTDDYVDITRALAKEVRWTSPSRAGRWRTRLGRLTWDLLIAITAAIVGGVVVGVLQGG